MASKIGLFRTVNNLARVPCRFSNTLMNVTIERHRKSRIAHTKESNEVQPKAKAPRDYRFVYPDFLPNPDWRRRDRICEMLERKDMIRRRLHVDLPEFYVGTIMAVTVADPHNPGKRNRFIGICIQRDGFGLRSHFTLRNVIDGQGLELMYEMYNPTLLKIEILKLEKRLDEELFYLRDAPKHHSTIPFDFEAVPHPPGAPVPVNNTKVQLNPRPWERRWEREDLKGVEDLGLPERFYERAKEVSKPWEKHDLMKEYRSTIHEDEAADIMDVVHRDMTDMEKQKAKRRKMLPMDERT